MTPDAAVRPQAVEPPREHADHVVVSDVHMSLGFERCSHTNGVEARAVVPGNHDVELVRPAVQERLRGLIEQASGRPSGDSIRFHPWIYDVPGVVYAEHGSQYHDLNAFVSTFVEIARADGGEPTARLLRWDDEARCAVRTRPASRPLGSETGVGPVRLARVGAARLSLG